MVLVAGGDAGNAEQQQLNHEADDDSDKEVEDAGAVGEGGEGGTCVERHDYNRT